MDNKVVARRLIHLAKALLSEDDDKKDEKAQCEDAKAGDEDEKEDEKKGSDKNSETIDDWSPDDYSLEKTEKKKMNQNAKVTDITTFSDADTFEATISFDDDTEKEASGDDGIAEALLGLAQELSKEE